MKIRTQVKAGKKAMSPGAEVQHNQTLVRSRGLKVKSNIKAGPEIIVGSVGT